MKTHKLLVMLLALLFVFLCTSCNNETIQSSKKTENKTSTPSLTLTQSQVSVRPNVSGKNDLWADRKLKVGFVKEAASTMWNTQLVSYTIDTSSKEWNIELEFRDAQSIFRLQIEQIEELIEKKVDVIGLIPLIETGYEEVFTKAKEAGIPIILIDRTVNCADESLWTSYIVNDWEKEGEMAGKWIIENIGMDKYSGEEVKVIEITGELPPPYDENYNESIKINQIKEGFRKGIEGNKNVKIVDTLPGEFSSEQSLEVLKQYLRKDKDIDIVFCQNDDMALGAIYAIKAVDLVPGEDIQIVSILGTNAALKAIVEGKIACSVEANARLGDLFMEACVRLANGEEIEREIHPVDRVFDITNAQDELDARKVNGYGY